MSDLLENGNNGTTPPLLFENPGLLNYAQAAKYLGISEPYLKKLKLQGAVPYVSIGKSIRFRVASLNRWIQQKEVS